MKKSSRLYQPGNTPTLLHNYSGCFLTGLLFLLSLVALPAASRADVVTYTHTVQQPFNGSQSPDDARTAAIAKAKREVLEKAGTYLDSITVVKDHQLVQDQITALSSAVLQAEIVSQKNYVMGETFGIEIEAKVSVDTSTLEERIKSFLQDQSALAKAEKLERREKELLAKIKELEDRSIPLAATAKKDDKNRQVQGKLSQEFTAVTQMLSAVEANRKALALWDRVKFTNPGKALTYLNEAIRKDDHYAEAFNNRGIAYADLGKWRQSIRDYDSALRLEPQFSDAFNNRGTAYANLGETQKAIQDFDKAIQINPRFARAYYNRGTAHLSQGHSREAIDDFDKAIELDPAHDASYYNRGNICMEMGDFKKAIENYDQAIKLNSTNAAFYFNRGMAYSNLEQFQLACNDLDRAIQLNPGDISAVTNRGIVLFKSEQYRQAINDFDKVLSFQKKEARVYKYRGLSYLMLGEQKRFCSDLKTACKLGDCGGWEKVRNNGLCK